MSLATRCTHCDTIFKVVQDQLKVSEGWVRCGRCNQVFNALEGLFDMEREPPPQRSRPAVRAPEADQPEATGGSSPPPAPDSTPSMPPEEAASWPATAPAPESTPESTTESTPEPTPAAIEANFDIPEPVIQEGAVTHFDLDLPPGYAAPLPVPASPAPSVAPAAAAPAAYAATPEPAEPLTVPAPTIPAPEPTPEPEPPLAPPPPAPFFTAPTPAPTPRALPAAPPEALPVTDESDALDSRYLLTSEQVGSAGRKGRRRRGKGPEFADAQFPPDLISDSGWDTDWAYTDAPDGGQSTRPGDPSTLPGDTPTPEREPVMGSLLGLDAADTTGPGLLRPSDDQPATGERASKAYEPEQALPPPSQRKGRSGTRGRQPQAAAPEFIQQAERKAIWRHPAVRAVLGVLALLLSVLLAVQASHHWRNEIASRYPDTREALQQWCALAGCRITPPLGLEDLQVDNITLVKTSSQGDDAYRMTVIIQNRSSTPLAWPFVDITLTDPTGHVVVRRAFDARTAQSIPPGVDATSAAPAAVSPVPEAVPPNTSTTLQWQLRAPDLQLASYTAELFYP